MTLTQEKARKYHVNTLEELKRIAESVGCDLIKGEPNQLMLDLDTFEACAQYAERLPLITEKFKVMGSQTWKSRSGKTHIVLTLEWPELSVPERIALQAVLGSDPVREALAMFEWLVMQTDTISLFRPKEEKA